MIVFGRKVAHQTMIKLFRSHLHQKSLAQPVEIVPDGFEVCFGIFDREGLEGDCAQRVILVHWLVKSLQLASVGRCIIGEPSKDVEQNMVKGSRGLSYYSSRGINDEGIFPCEGIHNRCRCSSRSMSRNSLANGR